jgi:hypothetical protein
MACKLMCHATDAASECPHPLIALSSNGCTSVGQALMIAMMQRAEIGMRSCSYWNVKLEECYFASILS